MKKILRCIMPILLLITLVACGKDDPAQIANPWQDYDTLEEACCTVGFNMIYPEHIEGYGNPIFRTMNNELIEIIFHSDNNELRIRKAVCGETGNDISGDYGKYSEHTAVYNDKIDGDIAGNDGMAYRAIWQNDKYSYSITAQNGIEIDTMYDLMDVTR